MRLIDPKTFRSDLKPTGTIRTAYDLNNDSYLFEATGTEAKRFIDFLNADDDGRLLVLPCKVGDVLWDTESLTESPSRHIVLGFDVLQNLNMVHLSGGQSLPVSEIGKTVFLSREEAEEALKQEVEGDG